MTTAVPGANFIQQLNMRKEPKELEMRKFSPHLLQSEMHWETVKQLKHTKTGKEQPSTFQQDPERQVLGYNFLIPHISGLELQSLKYQAGCKRHLFLNPSINLNKVLRVLGHYWNFKSSRLVFRIWSRGQRHNRYSTQES